MGSSCILSFMAFFIELRGSESDAIGSCISVGSKMETIAFVKYLDILGHNLLRCFYLGHQLVQTCQIELTMSAALARIAAVAAILHCTRQSNTVTFSVKFFGL